MSDISSEAADTETAAADAPNESTATTADDAVDTTQTADDTPSDTPNISDTSDADGSGNEAESNTPAENLTKPREFTAAIEAPAIQTTINTLTALVEEARIWVTPDGLQVTTVDAANVAMDDLDLSATGFESYAASGGVLGLNLDRLEDIVNMAEPDDLIQFAYNAESGKLTIRIDDLEYTLAPIDAATIRSPPDDLPNLDLSATVTLEAADLNRGIRAADMVDDHVTLAVDADANTVHIVAEGDTDDVDLELAQTDLIDIATNDEDAEAIYSLDYLKNINKTISKDVELTLEFGTDYPLIISYEFADGDGDITRMLAPRIKTD